MLRFIPIVLFCIPLSAVANINYSAEAVNDQQNKITTIIMNAIIQKCDDVETREAYYNCVANSVNKIIKASTFPAPPIPWEQIPPREPGPDDVPDTLLRIAVMPDYPGKDRRSGDGPDDRSNDGPDGPVRKIPIPIGPWPGPDNPNSPNSEWPLL